MNTSPKQPQHKKGSPEDIAAKILRNRIPVDHVPSILDSTMDPQDVLPRNISVDLIRTSPFQRRTKIDPDHVKSLAESIEADGLLQDILVREMADGGYELVAGENRLAAFRLLGRATIPARTRIMSDQEAARALTADNIQHKALTDFETFLHFKMLNEAGYVTTDEALAKLVGKKRPYITKMWAFDAFPEEATSALKEHPGAIGSELALKLRSTGIAQEEPALVAQAIKEIAEKGMKQSTVISWIKQQKKNKANESGTESLISDKTILHKKKKVRIVVKEGSFQVSVKGLKGSDLEQIFMREIDNLIG